MGLAFGNKIISNNHEYGFKENVNEELTRVINARTDAVNAANQALSSKNSAKTSETNAKASETNAKSYMDATSGFKDTANTAATNAEKWAKSVDSDNIVHRAGNETISGGKVFKDTMFQALSNSESLTASSAYEERLLMTLDKNGQRIACYGGAINASGENRAYIAASAQINGTWKNNTIDAYLKPDGTFYTHVCTPASASANDTQIANCAWTNSRITSLMNNYRYVKQVWTSGTSWWRLWTDGWLEQGGNKVWNGAWNTLTFHKAFKNTNYYIGGNGWRTDSSPYQGFLCIKDLTTTNCNMWFSDDNTSNPGNVRWYACGYC